MRALCSLPVQLKGVQEEWAQDPQLRPQSLLVGNLMRELEPLLHRAISYLKLSDPRYLKGNGTGWSPFHQEPSLWGHY